MLLGISILLVEEVHMEMQDGNEGSITMILQSTVLVPTIEDVIALRLEIKSQLNMMAMS